MSDLVLCLTVSFLIHNIFAGNDYGNLPWAYKAKILKSQLQGGKMMKN